LVGIGERGTSEFQICWFLDDLVWLFDHTVWFHGVSDVWMNGWVLKKLSKDVFDGITDDVKDIKQELQHMYVCVPHVRKSTIHRDRSLLGK